MDTTTVPESTVPAPAPMPEIPTPNAGKIISVGELFKKTWSAYSGHLGTFVLLYFLYTLMMVLAAIPGGAALFFGVIFDRAVLIVLGALLILPAVYVAIWGMIGYMQVVARVVDGGEKAKFKDLWTKDARALVFRYFGARVLVGLCVFGGMLLLLVPGIIFGIWLSFVSWIVVFEGKSVLASFRTSRGYARGRFWPLLGRYVLLAVVVGGISIIIDTIFGSESVAASVINFVYNLLMPGFLYSYTYLLYKSAKATELPANS